MANIMPHFFRNKLSTQILLTWIYLIKQCNLQKLLPTLSVKPILKSRIPYQNVMNFAIKGTSSLNVNMLTKLPFRLPKVDFFLKLGLSAYSQYNQ